MLLSIALLGFGDVGRQVYNKLKRDPGFGIDFRVHIVQVQDVAKYNPVVINSEGWMVVNDEDSSDPVKRVTIGDDLEWLIESDGHDTVVDCTSYSEQSKDLVMALLRRGYWLHTCSKELVSKHWKELIDICKINQRASVSFNSIPASKTMKKFMDVDLTNYNFEEYKDLDLYSYREADADVTAEYIVRDIFSELKKRRFLSGANSSLIENKLYEYNKLYISQLLGGKFLSTKNNSALSLPSDPVNEYNFNSEGYRSKEFSKNNELLAAGCSFTFGSGVPEEAIWANTVANELKVSASLLALPGVSTSFIVEDLFRYFKAYGNPKLLLCLFPDSGRIEVPCDNKIIASPTHNTSILYTIHSLRDDDSNRRKYLKKPYDVEQLVSEHMALYSSIKSIRMLEQYCRATGIQLIWGTWNDEFNELVLEANKFDEFRFDNYFNLPEYFYAAHRAPLFDQVVPASENLISYEDCEGATSHINCRCFFGCHKDLLDTYGPDQFVRGLDHLLVGDHYSHPGVHMHAHFAEAFLAEIKKLAPRD
jgi:hypothetical protein